MVYSPLESVLPPPEDKEAVAKLVATMKEVSHYVYTLIS